MWIRVLKEFFWLWWDNFSKNIIISILGFLTNIPTLFFTMGLFIFARIPIEPPPSPEEINLFWLVMSILFGSSIFFPTQIGLLTVIRNFSTNTHKKLFQEFFQGIKENIGKSILFTIITALVYFLAIFSMIFYSSFFGNNIIGMILIVITFWYLVVFTLFFVILSLYIVFFPKDNIKTSVNRSWVIMMDNVFIVFLTVLTIVPIFIFSFISAVGMMLFYQGLVNSLLIAMFTVILKKYKILEDIPDNRTIKDLFKPF
ncbi:MAG: DUF624 domain-containing protein [Brevinematia bacterium]